MVRFYTLVILLTCFVNVMHAENTGDSIIGHIKQLRIEGVLEARKGDEEGRRRNREIRSKRSEIIRRLASGEDLSEDKFLYEALGLEGVDAPTVTEVLLDLRERGESRKWAFIGLLRNDHSDAWAEIDQLLDGSVAEIVKALNALTHVNSKRSVYLAAQFLESDERIAEPGQSYMVDELAPLRYHAVAVISHVISNDNPTDPKVVGFIYEEDVEAWQQWWAKHHQDYSSAEVQKKQKKKERMVPGEIGATSDSDTYVKSISDSGGQPSQWWIWLICATGIIICIVLIVRQRRNLKDTHKN